MRRVMTRLELINMVGKSNKVSSPFHEENYKTKVKKKHKGWFDYEFDDVWYLYALIFGCFGILVLVLVQRKLTRQKGKWGKNLSINNIYMYRDGLSPSQNKSESKGEIECRRYLETIFQVPFPKARPDFLKNPVTGNNLELDCFNPTGDCRG